MTIKFKDGTIQEIETTEIDTDALDRIFAGICKDSFIRIGNIIADADEILFILE